MPFASDENQYPIQTATAGTIVRGKVLHRIFRNEENGYTVLSVDAHGLGEVIVAVSTPMPPVKGEIIVAEGAWAAYKNRQQLKATSIRTEVDRSDSGLIAWLKSQNVKGVGTSTHKQLTEKFRGRVHDVIGDAAIMIAGGIKRAKATAIADAWTADRGRAEFVSKMMGYGLTSKQVIKVEELFGAGACRLAETNPWELTEVDGIGFLTCDRIAERARLDMACDARLQAGLGWVLYENLVQNGHCGVPMEYLQYHAARLLGVDRTRIVEACGTFVDGENIVFDDSVGLVYGRVLLEAERKVVSRLLRLRDRSSGATSPAQAEEALRAAEDELGLILDKEGGQFEAAMSALTEPVMVITGGPGTGKSTIQKVVVKALETLGKTVLLAAPTGRASKRLSETSGREATTIHRLLEFDHTIGDFRRNEAKPLGSNAVIIDEFSMVDVRLAASVLSAVKMGTSFVMVGDFDQLPSVGPGQVLRDVIESGEIPVSRLTRVRRQVAGSGISLAASRVREGFAPWEGEEPLADDFRVVDTDESRVADTILAMLKRSLEQGYRPIHDIQVLAAMRKGEAGVERLNISIKDMLNPVMEDDGKSMRMGNKWFTVNDRVMQVRNDYSKGVNNGEVGTVVSVGRGMEGSQDNKPWVMADYGGTIAKYIMSDIDDMVLAYAATVHKSQGCEFPVVIVACPESHRRMLSRNLLYTAMTRARTQCRLVGSMSVIKKAAATEDVFKRYTGLRQRLTGEA